MAPQIEETFNVSVEINPGLELLTLAISIVKSPLPNTDQKASFKVARDQETLAILSKDADHRWKQVEGSMDQAQVDAIGSAIDAHYS